MPKITPHLWFDDQAEEAAGFYTSIFPNSKIVSTDYYPKAAEEVSGKPAGSVMTVEFELDGQKFVALNGGPEFKFTEAISFLVSCKDQDEIDYYWEKLTQGGEEVQCGWLKDKFGLSWQIVPTGLEELMSDPQKVELVTQAFLDMKKIDIETLRKAANQ